MLAQGGAADDAETMVFITFPGPVKVSAVAPCYRVRQRTFTNHTSSENVIHIMVFGAFVVSSNT